MTTNSQHDLLDRLVAEYADLLASGGRPDPEPFLRQVDEAHREALARTLRMIEAGVASAPTGPVALAPGTRLDQYRLVREIGRGGMSVVYLAVQEDLEREVALKILRPALAVEGVHVDRFRREALAIARVDHPNIVTVHAVGEARGLHYIAMEHVAGRTLADVISALHPEGAAPASWTADDLARETGRVVQGGRHADRGVALAQLLAPVAEALAAAHELGLVHRDVKPSNILIRPDGTPLVADFGLAKGAGDPALSMTGDTLGTPYYMSPEQAGALQDAVDHRTDVYSLGVTFYEALTGRRPFTGASALDVLEAIRHKAPPSLKRIAPGVSRDTEAVIRRAMARSPEHRYESARDLAEDLRRLGEHRETRARLEEGGWWGRRRANLRMGIVGDAYESRSETTFLGLPLYHVYHGRRLPGQRLRVAKGWFAAGDVAIGGVAFGAISVGLLSCGALAFGLLFGMGAIGVGGLASGGIAAGGYAFGGMAAGFLAIGGMAFGYGAIGGMANGTYAMGGEVEGTYVISEAVQDPEAIEFFGRWLPWGAEMIEKVTGG